MTVNQICARNTKTSGFPLTKPPKERYEQAFMKVSRLLLQLALGKRLPITAGTIKVEGINETITIRRDNFGIPHIEAATDEDAWYAVGFCQGQDRSFQLEITLRVARGNLSELLGSKFKATDRLSRQIGFLHNAKMQISMIDERILNVIKAFAKGLNHGSTFGSKRRSHEFVILGTKPSNCEAEDIIAISKVQAFAISSNWDIEIARYQILQHDGPGAVRSLDPEYPEWQSTILSQGEPQGARADRLAEDVDSLLKLAHSNGGSNSWALSSSRTSTNRPIVANDPHLKPTVPSSWYLAHVTTPNWSAAGATFIGTPAFPAGHNEVAAWGVTAGMVDTCDLFIEKIGPDGLSVQQGNRFEECSIREENIAVRDKSDIVERVLTTPRGPIIGETKGANTEAFSLAATWLKPRPIRGLLDIHRAKTMDEFKAACSEWPLSSLNMIYADSTDTIGWQMVGDAPRRRQGWGIVPKPGWASESGWEPDPIPFDQMPCLVNPPDGIIATANNSPTSDGDGPYLGMDWFDGYRQSRIIELLQPSSEWDVSSTMKVHLDKYCIPWREIKPHLPKSVSSMEASLAIKILSEWDCNLSVTSNAATVFQFFISEIYRMIAKTKAPKSWKWALGNGPNKIVPYNRLVARRMGHLSRLLRDKPDGWFSTGWDRIIEDALSKAITKLRKDFGNNTTKWAWGRVRQLTLKHPLGDSPLFRHIFNIGPFEWGGDVNTISQSAAPPENPTANPMAIASMRMVLDVGSWENNRFILPSGQSGNPLSRHYDDMLKLWQRGEGVQIAWSEDKVMESTRTTLKLSPKEADDEP